MTGRHRFRTPDAHALPEDLTLFKAVNELARACGVPDVDAGSCVMRPVVERDEQLRVEFHGESLTVGAQAQAFKQALVEAGCFAADSIKESPYKIAKEGGVMFYPSEKDYFGHTLLIPIEENGGITALAGKVSSAASRTREENLLNGQPVEGAKFRITQEEKLAESIKKYAETVDFPKSRIDEQLSAPGVTFEGDTLRVSVRAKFHGEKRAERPSQTAMQQLASFQSKVYQEVLGEKPVGLSVKSRDGQWIARGGFEGYDGTTEFSLDTKAHGGIHALTAKFDAATEKHLAEHPKDTRFQDGIRAEREAIANEQRSR
ncbi:MAG: hypothetical protein FJX23_10900 [Alphaproteobacteria bacterium]|nr:hypothetical protein [Alphaproteobacteria bacterium]